jgi:hypothetical protein
MSSPLSRRWLPSLLLVPGLLVPLALASSALAQDIAAAESLFNRGRADMAAGRYEAGCKAIAESQRLDPRPGTLFTLAVCEAKWGRIATAAARYSDYLSLYERLPPAEKARQTERAQQAKAQREALAPQVPELTLVLPPRAPTGTVVQRDGAVMADAALGVALPVDPGEHVLTTQAPGGPVWEQRITLSKKEKKHLTLEVKPAPEPESQPVNAETQPVKPVNPEAPPPKGAEGSGGGGQRVAAYVVGGIGIAGLALGGVMGGLALAKKGTVTDHCGKGIGAKSEVACDPTGLDAVSSGRTLSLVSTIGFAAGGGAVAIAAVLLLTAPSQAKPVEGSRRRWITAGMLQAGPEGAVVGVRGGW